MLFAPWTAVPFQETCDLDHLGLGSNDDESVHGMTLCHSSYRPSAFRAFFQPVLDDLAATTARSAAWRLHCRRGNRPAAAVAIAQNVRRSASTGLAQVIAPGLLMRICNSGVREFDRKTRRSQR
jgi:hypothetical protein